MTTFTYSIYDSNPNTSGPGSWPSHDGVEIEAESADAALAAALTEARVEGAACGEYSDDDYLWVQVWDEDDTIVGFDKICVGE